MPAPLKLDPDATEAKVLDEFVERGIAHDRLAALRIAILVAGAAAGVLESGPSMSQPRHAAAAGDDPELAAESERISRPGKSSVSSSVAALKAMQKGRKKR